MFHFDIRDDDLSSYGTRLSAMEAKSTQEGVSVLFVEKKEKVEHIEKIFNIKFQDIPFEFIGK